jgi:hypothetical protein
MNFDIKLLQPEDINKLREAYLSALENNWETLEGYNDRDIWE